MPKTLSQIVEQIKLNVQHFDSETAAVLRNKDNGLLIDVREPTEHEESSVPGAINIPRGVLEMKVLALEPDFSRPIYLHCASAVRAALSAEQLHRIGYTHVYVITGELKNIIQAHSS
ncbi:rhodanese-like domain-containing protein [Paraglaciecola sp. L1A13]|uniref:rhodanese-like domain-containing protein n=1 Tax=Paraglaciecola sp. L1A13 TaxID=2686359 RepID=UPI00131E9BBF|nr:rhodanese-like domain-containing protein [Paraglaciecola sp. L1A13]|tara:strand:+ start:139 stop:489 length:351 start_codon:yes stop_codon:yes gene_type:complete